MKFSKRYLVLTLLVLTALVWKLNTWSDKYSAVETFRGAELKEEVFYPLMAQNINTTGGLSIFVNDEELSNNESVVILNNNLEPVCSLDFIKDTLKAAAYRVDETSALIQVTDDIYEVLINSNTAYKNGEDLTLMATPVESNGTVYVGLVDLCDIMGYELEYNSSSHSVYLYIDDVPALPSVYDLRESDRVSVIRDQGSSATCWACASIEALESAMLPWSSHYFSVEAMINDNSFDLDEDDGGEYTMALAYLLSWQGPTEEPDSEDGDISPVHLQGVKFYDSEDIDKIKWAVYRYGGVSTSIYANVTSSNLSKSSFYNSRTNSYCYTGNSKPNHDVVIIGWDDEYSANYFSSEVPGDGAFICQNSWGTGFGDKGVFYISYYDSNIGNQAVAYNNVDNNTTYSYIYQSDLCGWVGQVGYNKEWVYGANVFEAESDRQIEACGFYALGEDTSYQVYFVSDYQNTSSLGNRQLVASGMLEDAGYYTIKFSEAKTVMEGESFAIVLYISTPGSERPMAVEYTADSMTGAVDLTDGKGFISNNGLDWESSEDVAEANLCIKAYGNDIVEVFE